MTDANATGATGTPTDAVDEATNDVSTAEARELVADLVATPSPSGEEVAAAERLAAFFESHDREVWLDDVGNVRAPANDWVLLTSHVDTVPGDVPTCITDADATLTDAETVANDAEAVANDADVATTAESDDATLPTDGTTLVDDDAVLWGRGSVDATGPLAAMAVAAVETGASFVGVVGEETTSRGAHHLVADRDAPDAVVNGEPSGWDALTLGYRGFVAATYEVATEAAHSSLPDLNAVEHATAWVEDVKDAFESPLGPGADEHEDASVFESVTVKPVMVDAGTEPGGNAVTATVDCQFRIPPGTDAEEIEATVDAVTRRGVVEFGDAIPPHVASPRTELGRAFRTAIRRAGGEPSLLRKTGTADANLYDAAWDCPVATYGPGDSSLDHSPDEHLALADYDRAVAVLESVVASQQ
ncbi:[LysW]-lysine hydrolase [Halorubellus sp. JP-L1]|uniref:[LysW]-lysine hydrolase n=1 Tax=Halorubellus sp. JP-L1 TaxID=2715753 RepID=UPI00140E92B5|nr:[LysW]-lysine hydrolase [Halorubellus sp. JP-L1]NHN43336.1 [LysW]-lysine hydrolase [Halorubellus sp. JP-L1]